MPEGSTTSATGNAFLDLVIVAGLILIGSFFAASEIALITVKRHRLQQLVNEGNHSARVAQRLTEDPSRFLATIQIALTFLGFLASAFGALSFSGVVASWIRAIPVDFIRNAAGTIAFIGVTLVVALLSIIVGELVPKTLALSFAERFALTVARPIRLIEQVLSPIVWFVSKLSGILVRAVGGREKAAAGLPVDRGAQDPGRERLAAGRHRGRREGHDHRRNRARRQEGPRGDGAAHRDPRGRRGRRS